ncbi:hypothetical protein LCGC14_1113560, partial [marine sediment metagenome]
KVNNYLGVGAGLSGVAGTVIHVKDTTPTIRIEGTGTTATLSFYKSAADVFKISTNLDTATTSLNFGATNVITLTSSAVTVEKNTTFNGATNTVTNDLEVTGTLTAGVFIGVATDVVINNGPVTISGGWTFIADGAIAHDKLAGVVAGNILIGNVSNVPTSMSVSGDLQFSSTGVATIQNDAVTLAKMYPQNDDTIFGGTGGAVSALTCNSAGDITFARTSTSLSFTIDNDIITNTMINSSAAIDMDKTAFNLSISGLVMNGNTMELASAVPADYFFRSTPAGTIITYGGNATGLASTGLIEPVVGWLFCNGESFTQGQYPNLYEALGDAWGTGTLPDLQGAFLRGVDPSNLIDTERGSNDIGSYQASALGAHTHTVDDKYYPKDSNNGTGGGADPNIKLIGAAITTDEETTSSTGGAETRPLNYGIAYLIKY